jgi:hypothetical protein
LAADKPRLEEIERLLTLPTTTADERDNLEVKKREIIERNPSLKVRNGLFCLDYEHTRAYHPILILGLSSFFSYLLTYLTTY